MPPFSPDNVFHAGLDGIYCSGEIYLRSFKAVQPCLEFSELPPELRKLLIGKDNLRSINYLFVVEFLAPETFPSHVGELPWAGPSLIQFSTSPDEIDTAPGIATLLLQHVKYRDLVIKLSMCLLYALEYVLSLKIVNRSPYPVQMIG